MKLSATALLFIFIVLAAHGCATTGPTYSEMQSTMPSQNPETGRIYIYRATAFGAAIQPAVYVNDEEVGKSVPHGFFYVDRAPGNYEIKTSTEVKRTLSLKLDPGETCYVRLNISLGFFVGHVYPELVGRDAGESEIEDCHYLDQQ